MFQDGTNALCRMLNIGNTQSQAGGDAGKAYGQPVQAGGDAGKAYDQPVQAGGDAGKAYGKQLSVQELFQGAKQQSVTSSGGNVLQLRQEQLQQLQSQQQKQQQLQLQHLQQQKQQQLQLQQQPTRRRLVKFLL